MKYMIISDIHGNIDKLNIVIDIFYREKCNKLIILGDLFNYGLDYYKQDIIDILNNIYTKIIAVRGNCDDDISQLKFYMPYTQTINNTIFITHGHIYDTQDLFNLSEDIIITGHTHIAKIEKIKNKVFLNPGSISKPRMGEASFIILENNKVYLRNLENTTLKEYKIEA